MKKTLIHISIISIISLGMICCSEDFLNEPVPTDQVTSDVVFGSRAGVEALISGIMRAYRIQFRNPEAAGANSIYYARTVKGNDIIQRAIWFSRDYANDSREPTDTRTNFIWDYIYAGIIQENAIIQGVTDSDLSETDKQHTYSYDSTLPAPPIYTEVSLEGKPMSTLQEMYELIVSDLTTAADDLTHERLGKSYINKAVANGLLARVYQVMGNWTGAEIAARNAYGGNVNAVLDAGSYRDGFDKISNIEWIWGSPQRTDQSNFFWGAPHSHADHTTQSYAATFINNDFVALFSSTDVRNLFFTAYGVPPNDYRHYITTKFTFNFDSDHPYIRTPEMILVEAEAKYHNGDTPGAHNLLYALQSNRDPNAVKSSSTGNDLLEEILVERRKELYAEIGVEWFDAKRLRRGITRTGNHRIKNAASLLPDDKRFFLKIPQDEIDANEHIDESVNANR
jgi:hypothetical protein